MDVLRMEWLGYRCAYGRLMMEMTMITHPMRRDGMLALVTFAATSLGVCLKDSVAI